MTNLTPDDLRALHAHLQAQPPEVRERIEAARMMFEARCDRMGQASSLELCHALGRCLNGWQGRTRRRGVRS